MYGFAALDVRKDIRRDEIWKAPMLQFVGSEVLESVTEFSIGSWMGCGQRKVLKGTKTGVVVERGFGVRPPVVVGIAVAIVVAIGEYLGEIVVAVR